MRTAYLAPLALVAMMVAGCETNTPNSQANTMDLQQRSKAALQEMTTRDPGLQNLISNANGYVVFPDVGEGAVGIGGASGHGVVYKNGQAVGEVKMGELSAGPQVGGQSYAELIIFQNEKALNRLMNNSLEFGAEATATGVKAGAAAAAQFNNGVGVFILPRGGLEVGANLNGQHFTYHSTSGQQ